MEAQETIKWLKAISATQTESIHKNSVSERKDALHTAIYQVRIVEYLKTIIGGTADGSVAGIASDLRFGRIKIEEYDFKLSDF